jgi:hypothetical protein
MTAKQKRFLEKIIEKSNEIVKHSFLSKPMTLFYKQPGVPKSTYDPLLPKSKVFCVGRNESRNFEDDLFYDDKGNGDYQIVTRTNHLIVSFFHKAQDLIKFSESMSIAKKVQFQLFIEFRSFFLVFLLQIIGT